MLIAFCVGVLVIGLVVLHFDDFSVFGFLAAVLGGAGLLIAVIWFGIYNIGVDGQVMAWEQQYDMLTYQLENNLYDNDNDIGKKELMNQIQDWNTDLAWYKANQKDFWIGVFIPNVFDQFEYIPVRK